MARQQEGELTLREAAEELGIGYEEYLDLLSRRDLPISREVADTAAVEELRRCVLDSSRSRP